MAYFHCHVTRGPEPESSGDPVTSFDPRLRSRNKLTLDISSAQCVIFLPFFSACDLNLSRHVVSLAQTVMWDQSAPPGCRRSTDDPRFRWKRVFVGYSCFSFSCRRRLKSSLGNALMERFLHPEPWIYKHIFPSPLITTNNV